MSKQITDIADLPGVGEKTGDKLKNAGYVDMMSIAAASPMELANAAELGEATASKIIIAAREILEIGYETATAVLERRSQIGKVSTGSKNLDKLLGGGMETGAVTEFHGAFSSGKSQVGFQVAVNAQKEIDEGGLGGNVIFIDAEASLPYDEKVFIHRNNRLEHLPIGHIAEEVLMEAGKVGRLKKMGETLFTDFNPQNIKAISIDPSDYKVRTFTITGFIKHKPQEVFEIKLRSGRKAKITKYHNLFTLSEEGELKTIKTENLKPRMKVAMACKIPLGQNVEELDLSEMLEGERLWVRGGEGFKRLLNGMKRDLRKIAKENSENPDSVNNWIKRGALPLAVYNSIKDGMTVYDETELTIGGWSRKNCIPLKIKIDSELFRFLGLYVAEGSCVKKKYNHDTYSNTVIITNKAKDVEDFIVSYGEKLNLKFRRYKCDIKANSKPMAILIKRLNLGDSAQSKRAPSELLLNTAQENVQSFLEGYVRGDGNLGKYNGTTTCETKSFTLAENLLDITQTIGLPTRYRETHRTHDHKTGLPLDMRAICWQTRPEKSSRLEELPNDRRQIGILLKRAREEGGVSILALSKLCGLNIGTLSNIEIGRIKSVRRSTLSKILKHLDEHGEKLRKLLESDLWFDEVVSINPCGVESVYDFEVLPENKSVQNFIGTVVFHNTFRPDRIKQMAEALSMDVNKVLDNIFVARAYNSDHQMLLAEKAGELIRERGVKLIIVDSITSNFRADFTGRGELANRQQRLNRHLHALQRLADVYNVAIYITNQVMSRPDILYGDPTAPIGGHIIGHFCVPSNTLVQLADGRIIPIEDMHNPLEVTGFDLGSLKDLKAKCAGVYLNTESSKLLEIQCNSTIRATPEHKFFKLDNFEIKEVRANDLKEGDYIATARKINVDGSIQKLPAIKNPKLIRLNRKQVKTIKEWQGKKKVTRKELCKKIGIAPRQFRRILNQGYPTFEETIRSLSRFLGIENELGNLNITETNKYRNIRLPEYLNAKLSQCLGYFVGDGNFEKASLRLREERLDVIKDYKHLFENMFGIKTRISRVKDKNCYNLDVNSIVIKNLFLYLKEHVFELVSASPSDVVRSFIKGFVDAEGCAGKKSQRIEVGQMDKRILDFVQLLLLRFGIVSHVYKEKNGWSLDIYGQNAEKYLNEIGLTSKEKATKIRKFKIKRRREIVPIERKAIIKLVKDLKLHPTNFIDYKKDKYLERNTLVSLVKKIKALNMETEEDVKGKLEFLINLLNSDVGWQRIKKINTIQNYDPLYDITVPECENFIANGFLVHNSTVRAYLRKSKGENRIARIVDSPNLPEGECVFTITPEGIRDPEEK